ncbi:hypothetical protein [Leptothermofonsia sp. ETS-13]|uniref:hypothetical protein n=1 Tax=Leptothermofonsia sp. ETS-13 TaxID=3035696 RepID=UPI003BA1E05E
MTQAERAEPSLDCGRSRRGLVESVARPNDAPWRENGKSLALMEETQDKRDPEAKAIACYGVYLRAHSQMLVRCVEQRPRSKITGEFLAWIAQQVSQMGQRVRPLIGDNVSWHFSKPVRPWVR